MCYLGSNFLNTAKMSKEKRRDFQILSSSSEVLPKMETSVLSLAAKIKPVFPKDFDFVTFKNTKILYISDTSCFFNVLI